MAVAELQKSQAPTVATVPAGVYTRVVVNLDFTHAEIVVQDANGALYYQPVTKKDGLYVFGSSRLAWLDWLGAAFFVVVVMVEFFKNNSYDNAYYKPKPCP